jgi:general secretion pathway protein F/type IV pilus assembly protein PilC
MGTFEYIARTAGGEEVTGVMQADSQVAVARTLDERALYPVRIEPKAQDVLAARRSGRVRPRDVGVAYGQLADLLNSGVPLLRAMQVISQAGTGKALSSILRSVHDGVADGATLAEAMGAHPRVFPPLHCAMVRAGEEAGFVEDVLTNLSAFIERQDDLRSKIRGAMIYPSILVGIGALLLGGILIFLVPRFQQFFRSDTLPLPTRLLFGVSKALREGLPVFLAAVAGVGLGAGAFVRSRAGRRLWDRWRLHVPVLGHVFRMLAITRFCRILGTMLHNGVPILKALDISKDAAGCSRMAAAIEKAVQSVRAGERLARPLRDSGLFPAEVLEMIAVAEEANQLEKVLLHVADAVERRTNRRVDTAVRLIEPLILVAVAAAIGFVALGLIYPIVTMAEKFM